MSTIKINQFRARQFGSTPYGNLARFKFLLETTSTGAAANSNSTAALAVGDVVDLGPLPEGMRLDDSQSIISNALTESVTGSLGFAYEDGVDSAAVPQSASYFGSGINLASVGRVRNSTGNAIVTLPKPARLILTIAGAANAEAGKVEFLIDGELTGAN